MSVHRFVPGVFVGVLAGLLIGAPLGGWMSDRSDSFWWQVVLPWVLIVVFWVFIGYQLWRRRQLAR